ncbi:MAG TPA: rhodanese-like domain-containing protein [Candidatus Limnocylindrales bacterium]|nr:rhodanese-like domain-containing protein [Candidatus Limnocylindrales bacterium]
MLLRQFVVEGLGHLSTLVADESAGLAAVVDPRRDVDVYLAEARRRDLRISHVVETHLHNDYVSGGRELAALTGAQHVIGVGAELRYEHRPLRHGESFEVGALRFTALETPGHTPEHVCYALADTSRADEPLLLFTGGSLLVGAVGRTDLLGAENAVPYARAMFRSLREVILPHEDFVGVYPTHGAGSLCSTGIASTPTSTIGYERRHNPMLRPADVETFVRVLLSGQPSFPRYFALMRPLNQAGPRSLGGVVPFPRPLPLDEVRAVLDGGGLIVDLRSPVEHAVGHPPGAISIPAGPSFGTWLGWVVEPDRPLVFLLASPDEWDDAIRQALRIGYESVVGHVHGGWRAWVEAGLPVESTGRSTVRELAAALEAGGPHAPLVLDVRQASEYAAGHVPGAVHLAAGDLPDRLADLPRDRPIATVCASGYRSAIAASLLRRAGFRNVTWVADGLPAWRACGLPVERVDAEAGAAAGTGVEAERAREEVASEVPAQVEHRHG